MEFAMKLADYMHSDSKRDIMYFDETSFNGDSCIKKAWFYRG